MEATEQEKEVYQTMAKWLHKSIQGTLVKLINLSGSDLLWILKTIILILYLIHRVSRDRNYLLSGYQQN